MAGSFTDALERATLDHIFGGPDYTRPVTLYIGLSTTPINDDGTGITEPDQLDGYDRVAVDNDGVTPIWTLATTVGGVSSLENNAPISFPVATGPWGTVTHFFIADFPIGGAGEILAFGDLAVPKTVTSGDTATFATGDLIIRLD